MTAGDVFNQPPNLFMGDGRFYVFGEEQYKETVSHNDFVWFLCLFP